MFKGFTNHESKKEEENRARTHEINVCVHFSFAVESLSCSIIAHFQSLH